MAKEQAEETYEVEALLNDRITQGVHYYQVKWKGYNQTTWEPLANLDGCPLILAAYNRAKAKRALELHLNAKGNKVKLEKRERRSSVSGKRTRTPSPPTARGTGDRGSNRRSLPEGTKDRKDSRKVRDIRLFLKPSADKNSSVKKEKSSRRQSLSQSAAPSKSAAAQRVNRVECTPSPEDESSGSGPDASSVSDSNQTSMNPPSSQSDERYRYQKGVKTPVAKVKYNQETPLTHRLSSQPQSGAQGTWAQFLTNGYKPLEFWPTGGSAGSNSPSARPAFSPSIMQELKRDKLTIRLSSPDKYASKSPFKKSKNAKSHAKPLSEPIIVSSDDEDEYKTSWSAKRKASSSLTITVQPVITDTSADPRRASRSPSSANFYRDEGGRIPSPYPRHSAGFQSQRPTIVICEGTPHANKWRQVLKDVQGPPIHIENLVDNAGPPPGFTWINSCVWHPNVPTHEETVLAGCECSKADRCSDECPCNSHVDIPPYDLEGRVLFDRSIPIFECNANCSCNMNCRNRVVQRGRTFPLKIFRSDQGKGWGVKTLSYIPAFTFVESYAGEVITNAMAEQRGKQYDAQDTTYLFDLDYDENPPAYTIDARHKGNAAHFFNHSCDPNLQVFVIYVDNPRIYQLAFFATKDIEPGEELTFDYLGGADKPQQDAMHSYKCLCKSEYCRGWVV